MAISEYLCTCALVSMYYPSNLINECLSLWKKRETPTLGFGPKKLVCWTANCKVTKKDREKSKIIPQKGKYFSSNPKKVQQVPGLYVFYFYALITWFEYFEVNGVKTNGLSISI